MHLKDQKLRPNHLAAKCAPYNGSPRSALTWEDWLQAAACSSREQAWRRALGGNNLTSAPPLPRPQHELRTGFREKEEKHRINQRREKGRRGQGRGRQEREGSVGREDAESLRGVIRLESRLYWNGIIWKSGKTQFHCLGHMMAVKRCDANLKNTTSGPWDFMHQFMRWIMTAVLLKHYIILTWCVHIYQSCKERHLRQYVYV